MTLPGDTGYSYIGIAKCGCVSAITKDLSDDPRGKKDLAKDVAGFVRDGLTIERVTHQEVRERFGFKCAEHTPKEKQQDLFSVGGIR